jgi:7-cyano-7-deazaguanine synthase
MSVVTLVSGGLDSTVMALLAKEIYTTQYPLFVDYGQRARERELASCRRSMERLGLPQPRVANLNGFGELVRSGLTDPALHILEDAFTPGRNLLFLLIGAAYGYTVGSQAVAIGLLNESTALFPDQTSSFLSTAEALLSVTLGQPMKVLSPLAGFTKRDVVELARLKNVDGTYSCHMGSEVPCGVCIACREFNFQEI